MRKIPFPELARLTTIARLFERRACEDSTARRPVTATRLGASRYVSEPAQLRCSGETKGGTNRWLEKEPLVPPVLDQRLWQCRAAGG